MPNEFYAIPGDTYTVEVEADGNGDVATENDAVELVGSHNRNPATQLVTARGNDVGVLLEDPEGYDSTATYSDGDHVGKAAMAVAKPILPVSADSGYTPSIGDYVTAVDGGGYTAITGPVATGLGGAVDNTLGVASDGTLQTNNASDIELDLTDGFPSGVVFDTDIPEFNAADMAVALIR